MSRHVADRICRKSRVRGLWPGQERRDSARTSEMQFNCTSLHRVLGCVRNRLIAIGEFGGGNFGGGEPIVAVSEPGSIGLSVGPSIWDRPFGTTSTFRSA
jgi:hypothetical protein